MESEFARTVVRDDVRDGGESSRGCVLTIEEYVQRRRDTILPYTQSNKRYIWKA